MKVLLITYYWPPAGGSGVQRWLKFIKYFSCFGIDPIVYTVENPSYAIEDESLMSEVPADLQVIREPIWEPNNILSKLKTNEAKQSAGFLNPDPSFLQRQMHYIRANYFIPDARKYWIKPSVRKLTTFLKENPVDVIISTGPPHSVHMIGYELKKLLGIKWLADFRDPWTNIDYFHNLPLTKGARKKHHELEDEVLKEADAILVVGKTMREEFIDRNQNVYVVSNGFDDRVDDDEVIMDRKFSISHIGMMNADRNPKIFWQALRELIDENEDFSRDLSVKLIGKCDEEVYQTVNDFALNNYVNFVAYVAHKDVLKFQRSSQLLLLAVNNVPSSRSVITGKVFEYLQSNRPIIGIGPVDGDLAVILNESEAGHMVDFDDLVSMKKILKSYYEQFKSGELPTHTKNIDRYHRKNLTKELTAILKKL